MDENMESFNIKIKNIQYEEYGATTVSVAAALLISLSLCFACAGLLWSFTRNAELQHISDACAEAGAAAVGDYVSCVNLSDAISSSMTLVSSSLLATGLVASCVPGGQIAGETLFHLGQNILRAKNNFVKTAAKGLQQIEKALPLLVNLRSFDAVTKNAEHTRYIGLAFPFPQTSKSDFSTFDIEENDEGEELEQKRADLARQAQNVDTLQKQMNAAKQEAWEYDCHNTKSARECAAHLANLLADKNRDYPQLEGWNFSCALERARAYYDARLSQNKAENQSPEACVDAKCREYFYRYACECMQQSFASEDAHGNVAMNLKELPKNTDEMKATSLYNQPLWPVSDENGIHVLHGYDECPGITTGIIAYDSLCNFDAGTCQECSICHMRSSCLGKVGSASTNIDNGYEYFWDHIVQASKKYQNAQNELQHEQKNLQDKSNESSQAFETLLQQITTKRPNICPSGAYGCIACVIRTDKQTSPDELKRFLHERAKLPPGVAISGAALAPKENSSVLSSFFDGISPNGIPDKVFELWSSILEGYSENISGLEKSADAIARDIDGVFGGSVAQQLQNQLKGLLQSLGIGAVDIRLRQPVLVNTHEILAQAGYDHDEQIRFIVSNLPEKNTPEQWKNSMQDILSEIMQDQSLHIATIEIPYTSFTYSIDIPLSAFLEAA